MNFGIKNISNIIAVNKREEKTYKVPRTSILEWKQISKVRLTALSRLILLLKTTIKCLAEQGKIFDVLNMKLRI